VCTTYGSPILYGKCLQEQNALLVQENKNKMLTYRKTKTSAHVRTYMCFGWYVYIYIYALVSVTLFVCVDLFAHIYIYIDIEYRLE